MKLTIERELLLEAMARVMGAVQSRVTSPILANIRLDAAARALLIRGTDLDIEIEVPCPAEVERQGVTTVDAKLLFEMVKRQPKAATLTVVADLTSLAVTQGRSKFRLNTIPACDFPQFGYNTGAVAFQWDSGALGRLIKRTQFAMSTDETRYFLNGIYVHVAGETLTAAATNGHQLGVKSEPLPAGASTMPGIILPRATVAVLDKFLPSRDAEIELSVAGAMLRLRLGEAVLATRLIDGTFPDYLRVIPSIHAGVAIVPRLQLLGAVELVSVVLSSDAKAVALRFEADSISVTACDADRGSGEDAVAECSYSGAPVTVGVNYKYLCDVLRATESAQIAIKLCGGDAGSEASGPLLFEDVDGDGSHRMVLMPMSV